jgi:hypothetical protein
VVQRLLLDWIDTVTAGATVGSEYNLIIKILTNKTQTSLSSVQLAEARTQVTLNPTIVQLVPVAGIHGIAIAHCHENPYKTSLQFATCTGSVFVTSKQHNTLFKV